MLSIRYIVFACVFGVLPGVVAVAEIAAPVPPTERVSLLFGGDVMFGLWRDGTLVRHSGPDPFAAMKPLIKSADFALMNFETPVCQKVPLKILEARRQPTYRFGALPSDVDLVSEAGFDLAVLANNHSLDCGREGVEATLAHMHRVGVATAGVALAGDPFAATLLEKGGVRIRVLALTSFINGRKRDPTFVAEMNLRSMRMQLTGKVRSIKQLDPEALIIVSIHWGPENKLRPVERQRGIAHDLIDAGAHVIMGHHTHVYQPVEVYHGGLILYSLGNLLFAQTAVLRSEAGPVFVEFSSLRERATKSWSLDNFRIQAFFREPDSSGPVPASPERAVPFLRRIQELSDEMYLTKLNMDASGLSWKR